MRANLVSILLLVAVLACITGGIQRFAGVPVADAKPAVASDVENRRELHSMVLDIATTYTKFERIDHVLRFAPDLCGDGVNDVPGSAGLPPITGQDQGNGISIGLTGTPAERRYKFGLLYSRSDDDMAHGKKVYRLFAKDRAKYLANRAGDQEIGQVLVKEAFSPFANSVNDASGDEAAINPATGKRYGAGEKLGLFIMAKLDPRTPGTDDGWIYVTTAPDGKTIRSAGRVANCMSCHRDTERTRDRMFGVD